MCLSFVHVSYIYIYVYTQYIHEHTHTFMCENKFYRENKQITFPVTFFQVFFSPQHFLSVGELYSDVVGFPTVVFSSASPLLTWKTFQVDKPRMHRATKNSTCKTFLECLNIFFPHFLHNPRGFFR